MAENTKDRKPRKTIDEQINEATKHLAKLKAKQRKQETEQRAVLGRLVQEIFPDMPDGIDAQREYLERLKSGVPQEPEKPQAKEVPAVKNARPAVEHIESTAEEHNPTQRPKRKLQSNSDLASEFNLKLD